MKIRSKESMQKESKTARRVERERIIYPAATWLLLILFILTIPSLLYHWLSLGTISSFFALFLLAINFLMIIALFQKGLFWAIFLLTISVLRVLATLYIFMRLPLAGEVPLVALQGYFLAGVFSFTIALLLLGLTYYHVSAVNGLRLRIPFVGYH